jgi:hypothetical protein
MLYKANNPLHGDDEGGSAFSSTTVSKSAPEETLCERGASGGREGSTDRNDETDLVVNKGKVGVWMLVGLTFYSVSGGPLGSEIAVRAAGPAIALLGFLIMPLAWSLPEAVMTAELSIAYPEVNDDCSQFKHKSCSFFLIF